jgi:hypothetical protein
MEFYYYEGVIGWVFMGPFKLRTVGTLFFF